MSTRSVYFLALALATLAAPQSLRAQAPAGDSARGGAPRHVLSLSMGMLPRMSVSAAGAETSGVLGGLSYQFWPDASWNVEISASAHSAAAHAWETHAVTSLLFGGNWYPPRLAPAPELRPYLGLAVGPYMASETNAATVRTQNVAGMRLAAGADAFPARWFRLGLRAAYHLAPDYEHPVDGLSSASGAELSVQVGVAWGRH